MNILSRNNSSIYRLISTGKFFSSKTIPRNTIEHLYGSQAHHENGFIYDKKPFKMHLKADTKYIWCLCGRGHAQPLCDSTHKYVHYKIKQEPVRFQVEKDGDYYLCNCKQTKNRPFCDGSHKSLP